jgi:hypothetical protein
MVRLMCTSCTLKPSRLNIVFSRITVRVFVFGIGRDEAGGLDGGIGRAARGGSGCGFRKRSDAGIVGNGASAGGDTGRPEADTGEGYPGAIGTGGV